MTDGPDRADAVQPIRDSDARHLGVDRRRPRPRRGTDHGGARPLRSLPLPAGRGPLRLRARHHTPARPGHPVSNRARGARATAGVLAGATGRGRRPDCAHDNARVGGCASCCVSCLAEPGSGPDRVAPRHRVGRLRARVHPEPRPALPPVGGGRAGHQRCRPADVVAERLRDRRCRGHARSATGPPATRASASTRTSGATRAGVVFTTRTGLHAGNGLVYMPIADTIEANDEELFGAEPGRLGDELATAGIARAVIANGDGTDPSTPDTRSTPWRRAAVAALMTSAGRVPGGRVDDGLLRQDPAAPFGVRLDPGRVERAFEEAWRPGSVVLVEGSDLIRADVQVEVRVRRAGGEDARRRARGHRPDRRAVAGQRRRPRHGRGHGADAAAGSATRSAWLRCAPRGWSPACCAPPRRSTTAS